MNSKNLRINEAYRSDVLVVKRSPIHRWGVFTRKEVKQYDVLEEAPYFEVSNEEIALSPQCDRYTYWLSENSVLIGLGYAGLYNHSGNANVTYEIDYVNELIRHYAVVDIAPESELTLNYGAENIANLNLTN